MELTQEQIDAFAQQIAASIAGNRSEEEPDWIKDIRRIASDGDNKTREQVKKEVIEELVPYLKPLVQRGAIDGFTRGLADDEAEITRELLKERYEKNPEGVFSAAQDDLTVRAIQSLAREEARKKRESTEEGKKKEPIQTEIQEEAQVTKKAEDLKRYLDSAGVSKTMEEAALIAAKEVQV